MKFEILTSGIHHRCRRMFVSDIDYRCAGKKKKVGELRGDIGAN